MRPVDVVAVVSGVVGIVVAIIILITTLKSIMPDVRKVLQDATPRERREMYFTLGLGIIGMVALILFMVTTIIGAVV